MSYQAANEIVTMYMQSNATRINNAMESAYKEALTQYQSEQEARKAALSVLKLEQKSYDDYLKILARNMKELRSGNINMAKKRAEILEFNRANIFKYNEKNRLEREKVAEYNKHERQRVAEKNLMQTYKDSIKRLELAASLKEEKQRLEAAKVAAEDGLIKLEMNAGRHADSVVKTTLASSISKGIGDLKNVFSRLDDPNLLLASSITNTLNRSGFAEGVAASISDAEKQAKTTRGYIPDYNPKNPGGMKDTRYKYKKAAVRDAIRQDILTTFESSYTGNDKEEKRKEVEKQVDILLNEPSADVYASLSGMFADVKHITPEDVDFRHEEEKRLFKEDQEPKFRKAINKKFNITIPPPPKYSPRLKSPRTFKPYLKDVPEESGTEKDYIEGLRRAAQPVFDELRQEDDTPFVLTKEEIGTVAKGAIDAYKELQIERTRTPYIPVEERRLLDDMALERQLNILRQRQQVASINPRLQSQEQIRSRAGQLLESQKPRKKVNPGSPLEQRFFATQGEALKMSYESDEELSDRGKPEEMGSMLYKSSFNPLTSQFRDNQSYQSVVDQIEVAFPKPLEQFKAIAAYNSRVMKQQRSKSPIVLEDGSINREHLEALKAISQKKKK